MRPEIVAVVAVLVLALIFVAAQQTAKAPPRETMLAYTPYNVLNADLEKHQGRGSANPIPVARANFAGPADRSAADPSPERLMEAERTMWSAATGAADAFNPEDSSDIGTSMMRQHEVAPAINYDSFVSDMAVEPQVKEQHARWVSEIKPFWQGAMKVDDLEMENYLDFRGLRRPQPVVIGSPMQLPEVGTQDLERNKPFLFTVNSV